jgi:hypothetical protein
MERANVAGCPDDAELLRVMAYALDEFDQQEPIPESPYGNDIISRTDPTTIGSEQYNRELAKAQEPISDRAYPGNEADVNWDDVSRLVNLRLRAEQQKAKAEEQAIRFAGQQEYQQLIDGGATPQEALRRTAHKLYYNSPAHLTAALRFTQPPAAAPTELKAQPITTPDGKQIGWGIPNPRGGVHLVNEPGSRTAPMTEAQKVEKTLALKELNTAQAGLVEADKKLLAAKSARFKNKDTISALASDVNNFSNRLETAKQRFRAGGAAPEIAGAAAVSEAAPAAAGRPVPDSPDKLEVGVSYVTPKGTFTWTGKGWKKPATAELPLMPSGDIQDDNADNER